MPCQIILHDGPLPRADHAHRSPGIGAQITFEGIVRPSEAERAIVALDYEVYSPMAENQLTALGNAMIDQHHLQSLRVEHSRGRVPVGAVSFRLTIESAHRKEGIRAMDEFIDLLKRDVPIWKTAVEE